MTGNVLQRNSFILKKQLFLNGYRPITLLNQPSSDCPVKLNSCDQLSEIAKDASSECFYITTCSNS